MNRSNGEPITRRTALRLVASGTGLVLLAACAAPAPPASTVTATSQETQPTNSPPATPTVIAPATSASDVAKPTGTPRAGGTLRFGQIGDLVNIDPGFNQGSSENSWLPYDRIIAYDLQFRPQPMLAESWDVSPDFKQIKLNLRKGVQFHNGREMTSDDVKYNILRVRDPKVGVGQFSASSMWFERVDTPDKYTVVLGSDTPRPLVFDFLDNLNIGDKGTLEGPDAKTKSVGTGPFTFAEWAPGDHLTYARNENYWRSGRPYLDSIRTTIFRDAQAMVTSFEAGALDDIRTPTKADFARLQKETKFQALIHPANSGAYAVGINVKKPPLDNKQVRQAFNYAINRQRFVDTILNGLGTPLSLPWASTYPAYEASKATFYTFDLDKAKSLLNGAGITSLSVDIIPNPGDPDLSTFAEMYQNDLATIGVKLNIVKLDMAAWSDQVNGNTFAGLYASGSNLQGSPGSIFTNSRPIGPKNNNEGFDDPNYAKLVADLAVEPDPTKQKEIESQLNDMLLDQSFFNFMSPNLVLGVTLPQVHGVTPNLHGGWDFTDTWIEA